MRHRLLRALHVLLTVLILFSSAPAGASTRLNAPQAGETLFILPPQAAPGADLYLSGAGFLPDTPLEFILYSASLPDGLSLGTAIAGSGGAFRSLAFLPDVPAGDYTIAVNNRTLTPDTSLRVLAPPEIFLDQPGGPPGALVGFTVTNLTAGSLRLDYAGVPVFGPAPVAGGEYSSAFIVPRDRPAVLGEPVALAAVNLVNGRAVGRSETVFESMPSPSPVDYTFSRVDLPTGEFAAGEPITVSGQISPAPDNLDLFSIKLLWKTQSGQVFPITQGLPLLQPDGGFTVQGQLPSLLNGAPAAAYPGAQIGVALVQSYGNETISSIAYTPWGALKPLPKFIVKVVDQNNNPIPNAIVDIRAPFGAEAKGQTTEGPSNAYSSVSLSLQNQQVSQALVGVLPSGENDPFNCPPSGTYGRTDLNGLFTFEFDPEKVALMGTKYVLDPLHKDKYAQIPTEVVFPLTVNALYTGHGQIVSGKPAPFQLEVRFSSFSKEFYNKLTNQKLSTEPYVVVQPALPPGTAIDVPAVPYFTGLPPFTVMNNFLGSGDPLYAFGKFLSFPDPLLYPNTIFSPAAPTLALRFQHDSLAFGVLDEANLSFTLEGVKYSFQKQNSYTTACGKVEYLAQITNPHRLKPGAYIGTMAIKDLSGHTTRRYVQLTMTSPPDWIGDTKLQNRIVYYNASPGSVTGYTSLFADVLAPGAPETTSTVGANLNKIGQVDNAAGASYNRGEGIYPGGQVTKYFNGQVDTTALNQDKKLLLQKPAPGGTSINFGDTLTILDTGRIPMFRSVWGVPPIASATIGADMWFKADLTYNGTISFGGPAGSSYSLLVSPSGTVGVDAFLDVSALFGVISAHASAVPQISFSIPATFENGKKLDSSRCFRYKLDIKWSASIGYCPLCLSEGGTKNIFKGHQPSDADPQVCSDPALEAGVEAAAATQPPPDADPSIAADGFGHTLAVWRSPDGLVVFSSYNGLSWSPPAALTGNTSSGSPKIAFFAPNQALAAWAQNGLAPAQAAAADFDTLARSQHLVYAVWNGSAWSTLQNLTAPTTGEGSLALAGCMNTTPGCPAGGAVAAAWVRDAGANLSLRQFRLFYAVYTSGAWSAVQAVDPASTATDSEPSLAYDAGAPWIAWVRDADRDLGTLGDHRLAHRKLAPGEPVVLDSALPAGPSQPSLAVDSQGRLALAFTVSTEPEAFISNKRQLYSARQACTPTCAWSYQALVDSHGRAIFGEGPSLALGEQDQAVIVYRALGLGPLANGLPAVFAGDAPGVIMGTGAIAQLHVDFAGAVFNPQYLTQGAAPGWQAAAAYDPLLQQVVVTAAEGPALPLVGQEALSASQPERITLDEPVIFASPPLLPDYAMLSALPSTQYPDPDVPFTVSLRLENRGAAPGRIGGSPVLAAAWDAPPGAGLPAGSLLVSELETTNAVTVTLAITHAPDLTAERRLYFGINPQQVLSEIGYANNSLALPIGGLPVPQDLSATAQQGQTLVILEWTPISDPRIAGFRIYRQDALGNVTPVGSSFTNGFADLTPLLGQEYEYLVASYDQSGSESARSAPLRVQLPPWRAYLPALLRGR